MSRPVRLQQVATAAQTSLTAVSAVLHGGAASIRIADDRRRHIIDTARQLGYRPNYDIALISRLHPNAGGDTGLRFFHALQTHSANPIHIQTTSDSPIPDLIARWKVGAAIIFDLPAVQAKAACDERGIPVLYANPAEATQQPANAIDEAPGIQAAVANAIANGCQRLALLAPRIHHQAHTQRITALRALADQHRIPLCIADDHDFHRACASVRIERTPACAIIVLADWFLAAEAVLHGNGLPHHEKPHQLICMKRPLSPWIQPTHSIDIPWDIVAQQCLTFIDHMWDKRPTPLLTTIATTWHHPEPTP